jgi:phage terminase small subunit
MKTKARLRPQPERFCQEYIKDLNGTQAAIRAGYSEKSAFAQASQLLSLHKVVVRIDQLKLARQQRTEITSDRVMQELAVIGFSDIADFIDENGCVRPIKDIPPHSRRAISSFEVIEIFHGHGENKVCIGQHKKIRFWDKNKALEIMTKHLGIPDKIEIIDKSPSKRKSLEEIQADIDALDEEAKCLLSKSKS